MRSFFKKHKKKILIFGLIFIMLLSAIGVYSYLTDRKEAMATVSVSTFEKDGYTLIRTADEQPITEGDTVTIAITEANATEGKVKTKVSLSATWTPVAKDAKIWGNDDAKYDAILKLDGEILPYTVNDDGTISFDLPEMEIEAQSTHKARNLTLTLPYNLESTGTVHFDFTKAIVSQIPGWSNTYTKEELNAAEDLSVDVLAGWAVGKIGDQNHLKNVIGYLTEGKTADTYGLKLIGEGEMMDLGVNIPDQGFYSNSPWVGYHLDKLDIGENITSIGSAAFMGQNTLTGDLTFSDNMKSIGRSSFEGTGFSSITIPDNVTLVGMAAFRDCDKNKKLTLGTGLTALTDSVFSCNSSLATINWGNSNIRTIGTSAFEQASSLKTIALPDSVKTVGTSAFAWGDAATSIDLNKVETIGYRAFDETQITSLVIPATVKSIDELAFFRAVNCKDITFEHGVNDSISLPSPQSYVENGEQLYRGAFRLYDTVMKTNVHYNREHPTLKNYVWIDDNRWVKSEPVMKAYSNHQTSTEDFKAYRDQITKVTVLDHYDLPSDVPSNKIWDVSAAGDESVMAYIDGTELFICSNVYSWDNPAKNIKTKVIANEKLSWLFYDFSKATEFDVTALDVSHVKYMDGVFASAENEYVPVQKIVGLTNWDVRQVQSMDYMFSGCDKLTSFDVSKWETDSLTTMTDIFAFCKSATTIDVKDWNVSNVWNFDWVFHECESLTTIPVQKWDTKSMTTARFMFNGCKNLVSTGLDVSNFKTNLATNLSYMFSGCEKLTTIDVSQWKTPKVQYFNDMFYNCTSLKSIDVTGFSTASTTNVNYMFEACTSLTELDLSSFDLSKVATYDDAYHIVGNCSSLKTLTIGKGIKDFTIFKARGLGALNKIIFNHASTDVVKFPTAGSTNGAFWVDPFVDTTIVTNNQAIKDYDWVTDQRMKRSVVLTSGSVFNATIPAGATSVVFTDEKAQDDAKLTDVSEKQDKGVVAWLDGTTYKVSTQRTGKKVVANENCKNLFKDKSSLTNLDIKNLDTSKVQTMCYMFGNLTGLSQLDVSTLDTSNVTDVSNMFRNFKGTSLDVSGFKTANVAIMFSMFNGCSNLQQLDLVGFDTSNVTSIQYMFFDCYELKSIDLSSFDTSNVTNMQHMFCVEDTDSDYTNGNGSKLETIILSPKFDTSNVKNMRSMFYGQSSLKSIDLSSFDTSNVTDMYGMFFNCRELTSLDVSGFNTANVNTMRFMFDKTVNITELDLSNFITTNLTDMGAMFSGMSSLTSLKGLDNFNTSNVTDMIEMFLSCHKLKSLDLSSFDTSNVTNMSNTFLGCRELQIVKLGGKFKFIGTTGYLPTPSSTNIIGATGKWYNSVGKAFLPNEIPINVADTYYAVQKSTTLVTGQDFNSTIPKTATSVVFTDEKAPNGVTLTDVSEAKDKGVVAWLDGTTYKVSTQRAGKKILANADCSKMFSSLKKFENINVNNLDTSNVTNMNSMFSDCSNLSSLDVTGFNTSNVTDMAKMFNGCGFSELDVSNMDTSKVVRMDYMFANTKLKSLDLKNFIIKDSLWGMECIFMGSSDLEKLDISGFDIIGSLMLGHDTPVFTSAFSGCDKLKEVVVGEGWITNKTRGYILPTQDSANIPGADGKWYNSKGEGFAPADIPSNVADTYYVSKE